MLSKTLQGSFKMPSRDVQHAHGFIEVSEDIIPEPQAHTTENMPFRSRKRFVDTLNLENRAVADLFNHID